MKLTALKIRDRLDRPSTALFSDEQWDLQMDGPLVTLTQKDTGKVFLVPMSNVIYAVPAAGKK